MTKATEGLQDQNKTGASDTHVQSRHRWMAIGTILVSSITITLLLLGYGVSFAEETAFGLSHGSMFDSTLDLTDLSSYALEELLSRTPSTLLESKLYIDLYERDWPVILLGVLAVGVIAAVARRRDRTRPTGRRSIPVFPASRPSSSDERASRHHQRLLGLAILFPLYPIAGAFMAMVFWSLVALIAIAPALGMKAGMCYIQDWVVSPDSCAPVLSRGLRMQASWQSNSEEVGPRSASCVIVWKDGVELGRGRVVFMTTKFVVLFDPVTGSVRRIPTSTGIIEVVSGLDRVLTAPRPN